MNEMRMIYEKAMPKALKGDKTMGGISQRDA